MKLSDYASIHKTAKFDVGYIDGFYEDLFCSRQNEQLNILEIGVHEGDSLKLWRDYFQYSTIYGIDILNLDFLKYEVGIVPIGLTNAYIFSTIRKLKQLSPYGFDIIIDDGPHTLQSMVSFLILYQNMLKPNGILVLEDIIDIKDITYLTNYLNKNTGTVTVLNMYDSIKNEKYKSLCKEKLEVIIYKKDKQCQTF